MEAKLMSREEMTRMSIDVPKDLHELIKSVASFEHKTIRDFVVEAVKKQLEVSVKEQKQALKTKYRRLNALTAQTLEKTDRGEDVHYYDSFEDFLAEVEAEEHNA
jgi:uncharacterized protein (DUF1778 family)